MGPAGPAGRVWYVELDHQPSRDARLPEAWAAVPPHSSLYDPIQPGRVIQSIIYKLTPRHGLQQVLAGVCQHGVGEQPHGTAAEHLQAPELSPARPLLQSRTGSPRSSSDAGRGIRHKIPGAGNSSHKVIPPPRTLNFQ